jgi:hypothetical protein
MGDYATRGVDSHMCLIIGSAQTRFFIAFYFVGSERLDDLVYNAEMLAEAIGAPSTPSAAFILGEKKGRPEI